MRAEFVRIMRFWLDLGASGFRVDMASSLVKQDRDGAAMRRFWQSMRRELEPRYPEMVLLAEWGSPALALAAGFHLDFLLHCGTFAEAYNSLLRNEPGRNVMPSSGHSFCDASGCGDITAFTKPFERELRAIRGLGRLAIASGNHDLPRIANNRSPAECAVALATILTLPGIPFIYYVDEIGMRYQPDLVSKEGGYNRTGSRTPMQWTSGHNAGFSTAPAKRLYLPVDMQPGAPSVAAQERDPASLLNQVRRLISVRRERSELFTDGEYRSIYAKKNAYPYVFLRRLGRERILVVINPSRRPVNVMLAKGLDSVKLLAGSGVRLSKCARGTRLVAEGITYGVFALR